MRSVTTRGSGRQGLGDLSRGVLGEAEAEARQTLDDARARADGIRKAAEEQSETRRQEIVAQARREVEPLRSQAVASAQLQAQRLGLESREAMLNQVFSAAREALPSAADWPDYPEILCRLIREAGANLAADEISLHADAQTQQHLSDAFLAEMGEQLGAELRRGEVLDGATGIVAETPDGHRRYRNTLEARLQRLQESLRAPVYRLLRGEAP
jgi:V/A-type H+-transporting ATPase subunit E